MKKMMNKLKMNWIASSISVSTMIMSPVAMGQEAQRISETQVQSALQQMGLNRQITVGDFYEKNKHLYPERIRKQIEPVMKMYKNVMMPEFTVTSAKGTDGRDITNVRVTQNGQLINLQWFGEENRFVKFQNTNLTQVDIVNFDDMFTRLLAGDENFRKQSEARPKPSAAMGKKFDYPTVTKADWKAMTPEQRAQYIMNMRLLWTDARKVLNEVQNGKKNKPKKTSSLEKFEFFWQTLLENAQANSPRAVAVGTLEQANPDSCLVAGYVSSYKSKVCDRNSFRVMIKDQYADVPVVKQANDHCAKSKRFACNPLVFGTPNGSPICLDPNKANFQIATHYEGPCEANNHLGFKVEFLKDTSKKKDRYDESNAESIEAIEAKLKQEAETNNYQATKDYIAGIMKFTGKNPITGEIDDATLESILEIRKNFAEEIGQARLNCVESAKKKSDHEKNFYGACDQLHRRMLFVAEYINKEKCGPTQTTIDPETLKCVCPDKSQVNPGAKCAPPTANPPPPSPVTPAPNPAPVVDEDCESKYPGAGASKQRGQCVCSNGSTPKLSLEGEGGAQVYTCSAPGAGKPPKDKGGGFFDAIWKGIKVIAPFALAGLAVWGMVKIMSPKKPKLNPAGDLCPNGTKAPCPQTCAPPLSLQASGQCGCSACPPSQTITNAATCTCGTTSPGGGSDTALLTCWDGTTKVDDLSKCPAQQYTCWDGSKVTNPLNCPERPATLVPTGGSQQ